MIVASALLTVLTIMGFVLWIAFCGLMGIEAWRLLMRRSDEISRKRERDD
jgi:hypothetical protein